ncbi:MAG: MazG-like family protein [bacterium]|nr:MazG-like family protein [bacterium]MCM1373858.1 MazG-like family protein [Muribaculum sp.]
MSRTFAEMQDIYKEVVNRFNKIELREWKAEGAMIELAKQVGELAKQVMIKERYYALEGETPDVDERLGNEMADVVAQIMRLADYYKIDLEKVFIEAREDEDRYLRSRGV